MILLVVGPIAPGRYIEEGFMVPGGEEVPRECYAGQAAVGIVRKFSVLIIQNRKAQSKPSGGVTDTGYAVELIAKLFDP